MLIKLPCLPAKCSALLIALLLPSVTTSIYFYQSKKREYSTTVVTVPENCTDKNPYKGQGHQKNEDDQELVEFSWKNGVALWRSHMKSAYSHPTIRLWSIWWILLHTGFYVMYYYNQPLWHFIEPGREDIYNGFAEAGLTLFGALGALLAAKLSQEFIEKWAIWIVVVCSMALGSFSIAAGQTTSVFVSYAMYISLGAVYYFMITVTK